MTEAAAHRSGKGHRDENFPVASHLIAKRHRPAILAFYDFVRTADDVADHPTLTPQEKLAALDRLEATLLGGGDGEREGVALRDALHERGLTPQHALDLLTAFKRDVTQPRYRDWDDLIDYCRYSAMPVGRFVLDVHGESQATWPASDAVCAALQINNHLQDCAKDYREINRVYVPLDALAAAGATVEELGAAKASPALRACLAGLAARTEDLLRSGTELPKQVNDTRLAIEIAVIIKLAERIVRRLRTHDPLSEHVHLGKGEVAAFSLAAVGKGLVQRLGRRRPAGAGDRAEDAAIAQQASGSSFNSAMRILPRVQRQAMLAIYAFCRAVDDIADNPGERGPRLAELQEWRTTVDSFYAGNAPVGWRPLATAISHYGLKRDDFLAVIDGMEMDAKGDIRAPDLRTLDLYCDRVASAVGRLSVRVFGVEGADGELLAHHLGRALQLTNILRDVDEDAAIGRLYLPREALEQAGIFTTDPRAVLNHPAIGQACVSVAEQAREHFAEADAIMRRNPRRAVRAPRIMGGVYRTLLDSLVQRGWSAPRRKIKVPKGRLVRIVLRHAVL